MRFPDGHGDGRHNENCARVVEAARDRVGHGLAQLALLIGRGAALLRTLFKIGAASPSVELVQNFR